MAEEFKESSIRSQEKTRERDRFRGRGRGAFMQHYEDMGVSSTEEGHAAFVSAKKRREASIAAAQKEYDKYNKSYKQDQATMGETASAIRTAQNQVNRYARELSSGMSFKDYKKANSGELAKVHVLAKDNSIEGTYTVGRKDLKDSDFPVIWKNGEAYVSVRQQGRTVGQEIHDKLNKEHQATNNALKLSYETAMSEALSSGNAQLRAASSQINKATSEYARNQQKVNTAGANLQAAADQISGAKKGMTQELGMIKSEYQKKLNILRDVLSGTKTDLGKMEAGEMPPSVTEAIKNQVLPEAVIQTEGKIDQEKVQILSEMLARAQTSKGKSTKRERPGIFQEVSNAAA